MSRIYEALQKAESERKSERGLRRDEEVMQQDQPSSMGAASQAAVADYEAPAVYDSPAARIDPDFRNGVINDVVEPSTFGLGVTTLNLDRIPRHVWTPVYTQLPALLERGPAVEQFRSLRSRIFELRDMRPLKSILISSGLPQEGKSFIATNLAISLARHKNSKVLLIDGDMRRYTLHQLLGCQPHPGLADYLSGKAELVEVMQRAAEMPTADKQHPAVLPNLTFIAGGNGGDKAADLSGNPRFGELIKAASPNFDWIIVDSSPVLPVSDAVNLARFCDGVLLVARGGVTKFPVAQRAQSELKASNILGFVLNAVEKTPQGGGYYGGYGYGYGYDADKKE
jgi:capsular exopolysaccharide synthesis family protein